MLAWGFGDFKGGEIFPWRNYPLRNCPRAKISPPLYSPGYSLKILTERMTVPNRKFVLILFKDEYCLFRLQSFVTHAATGKPTGVAVSHCRLWYHSQPILTACQTRSHNHLWDHRSTGPPGTLILRSHPEPRTVRRLRPLIFHLWPKNKNTKSLISKSSPGL